MKSPPLIGLFIPHRLTATQHNSLSKRSRDDTRCGPHATGVTTIIPSRGRTPVSRYRAQSTLRLGAYRPLAKKLYLKNAGLMF